MPCLHYTNRRTTGCTHTTVRVNQNRPTRGVYTSQTVVRPVVHTHNRPSQTQPSCTRRVYTSQTVVRPVVHTHNRPSQTEPSYTRCLRFTNRRTTCCTHTQPSESNRTILHAVFTLHKPSYDLLYTHTTVRVEQNRPTRGAEKLLMSYIYIKRVVLVIHVITDQFH